MSDNLEVMEFDVVIVGAGPAGLSTAIKLAQLAETSNKHLEICVLEKGSEVGAHILSGAVFDPISFDELIPNWKDLNTPIKTQATNDEFLFLTDNKAFKLPTPPQMYNKGNYIISLSNLCRWLGTYAENLGVQIFPGFPASEAIINKDNKVIGVRTKEMGIDKNSNKKPSYQPAMELHAKYTVLAEGCRGSISKQIINKFELDKNSCPQTYGLGIKELWEVPKKIHKPGTVIHTVGWPLDKKTYGGSFIYHMEPNLIAVGFVVGLDYENPYLSPYEEFQKFKHHPKFKGLFENSKRISYGARTIVEGGIQSLPKLSFPGGLLVGDAAGFLNVPKIKGSHSAIQSGIIAATNIFDEIDKDNVAIDLCRYSDSIKQSWVYKDLYKVRNIRPSFRYGLLPGLIYSGIDTYLLRGKAPWTFKHRADHTTLINKEQAKKINYPKADGKISFDRLSSVSLSGTMHEEDQPSHLKLTDNKTAITHNYKLYDSPEQRYCPAGVYEIVKTEENDPYLQINFTNCVHCKACDIKDPKQNINWTTPEGPGGPNYNGM